MEIFYKKPTRTVFVFAVGIDKTGIRNDDTGY